MNKKIQSQVLKEVWETEKICYDCKTIAYGDGNCHCGKNNWNLTDKEGMEKAISRTIELIEEDFQEGYKKGTKRMLNDTDNVYEIGVEDAKADFLQKINELMIHSKVINKKAYEFIDRDELLAKLGDNQEVGV